MEPWKDILAQALATERLRENLRDFTLDPAALAEMKCYQAIKDIKEILEREDLDDAACFWRIEEVLCRLEALGLFCGTRHDFG